VNLGSGCANNSKRRKASNDEKKREISSDEKCTESSSDEKQADIESSIEGGNLSMIAFSALQTYAIGGVVKWFEVYRNSLFDTGAEHLKETRHTAYYIPFDGIGSGMEVLFYVPLSPTPPHSLPQYINENDMERSEPNKRRKGDVADAIVHYCQDFRDLAANVWLDWATIRFRFYQHCATCTGIFCVFGPVLSSPAHGLTSLAMD
jgi:hypothetical protein